MWNLIPEKLMPPTRLVRYCCQELKETSGMGRYVATGVRWDERHKKENNTRSEFEKIGASVKSKELFDDSVMLNNDNNSKKKNH